MALNLLREARIFASLAFVSGTKQVSDAAAGIGGDRNVAAAFANTNTWKIPVLTGFSFSQQSQNQEITLTEAGPKPIRGKKVFNTAINPVDVSFTTYVRPYIDGSSNPQCIERILWEALACSAAPSSWAFTANWDATTVYAGASPKYLEVDFEDSDVHQLLKLNFYFAFENTTYLVRECVMNSAEISFDINGIAQISWSAQGKDIVEISTRTTSNDPSLTVAGTGYVDAPSTANFIANKLSLMTLTNYKAPGATCTHGYAKVNFTPGLVGTANAGLSAAAYTYSVQVDGGSVQNITYTGTTAKTVNDVVDEINKTIKGANAVLNPEGDIVITSLTAGTNSSVVFTEGAGTSLVDTMGTNVITAVAGTGTPKSYEIGITGGNLRVENNVTFLTPEELGVLNKPITHFTGTRSISGNFTCYLNTGLGTSGGLLSDLAQAQDTSSTDFELVMKVGGNNGGTMPTVYFKVPHAHINIPNIQSEDVLSLSIDFSGLGQDLTVKDELYVQYFPVAA